MRVKAYKIGEYANSIIEPGQVFDLVPRTGFRDVPQKNSKGEIVSIKRTKVLIPAESQFADSWMRKVKIGEKKTVRLERVGNELGVAEKTKTLPSIKHFHNGKEYNGELPGADLDEDELHDDPMVDNEEEPTEANTAPDAQGSDADLNVL